VLGSENGILTYLFGGKCLSLIMPAGAHNNIRSFSRGTLGKICSLYAQSFWEIDLTKPLSFITIMSAGGPHPAQVAFGKYPRDRYVSVQPCMCSRNMFYLCGEWIVDILIRSTFSLRGNEREWMADKLRTRTDCRMQIHQDQLSIHSFYYFTAPYCWWDTGSWTLPGGP